jgi:AmpD protein
VSGERWGIDDTGILSGARQIASPNCDARPHGGSVELLVIHNISLPPGFFGGNAIAELFTNCLDPRAHPYFRDIADLCVSSHFLIRRDGELIQFVPCGYRAWHAGESQWHDRQGCNDFSIGVELEGTDDLPFEEAQYRVLARLVATLRAAYPITACVGHCDIAQPPGRKTDPGPHFDWAHLETLEIDANSQN